MNFHTALIHSGNQKKEGLGATAVPIYQNNSFFQETAEGLEDIFKSQAFGYAYTRMGNPTITELETRVAKIEKGIGAVACASGMGAITMALLNILETGDEIIASPGLFSGTIGLFAELQTFGIQTRYVNEMTADEVEANINENTKAVFTELIGNPKLDVVDIRAVKEVTSRHKIPFFIDSTTATPYLLRPAELGADVIIHSASKYIGGSGNGVSGLVIDSGNFQWADFPSKGLEPYRNTGRFSYLMKLRKSLTQKFGPCLSPMNAYLNTVGLETLGVRMERQCTNTYEVASALAESGLLEEVHYPGLKSSPWYKTAVAQFGRKEVGAIFTFRTGSKERAYRILNNLTYPLIATNIGDVRSLVIHPASTIYVNSSETEKQKAGVYEDLIRVSIGLEDAEDLKKDFIHAIEKADQK